MSDYPDYAAYMDAYGESPNYQNAGYNSASSFEPPMQPNQGFYGDVGYPQGYAQEYGESYPQGYPAPYQYGHMNADHVFGGLPQLNRKDLSDVAEAPLFKMVDFEEKYPSWGEDTAAPLSKEEIWQVFQYLQKRLGFQQDSCLNMYDHFMTQLNSRTSRFPAAEALVSLHSDYIGGPHANYRKWYFAAQLDLDDDVGLEGSIIRSSTDEPERLTQQQIKKLSKTKEDYNLSSAVFRWKARMSKFSSKELVTQVALYLLIWGESNQVRFLPECLCYIYKCASDFLYLDNQAENDQEDVCFPANDFLDRVITPLYNYIKEQQFEKINGKYYRREKDHKFIVGYDDMNQLFWYPEGLGKIVSREGVFLKQVTKSKRYSKLGRVEWSRVFTKTYNESRSWFHLVTNFSRIWIIHLAAFWYTTAINSTSLYTPGYEQRIDNPATPQSPWSVTAFAGILVCIVHLMAIIGERCFVPKSWPGRERCTSKLIFGIFLLLINLTPPIYIFVFIPTDVYSSSAYVVSIVQFSISVVTVVFLSFQPLGGLFGSYLFKKQRFVSSQTFTASFPKLKGSGQILSLLLWSLVFIAKFLESYLFLTLSMKDPIRNLWTMLIDRCHGDVLIGNFLCKQQARIVLALMVLTDLILFFLDTYLWYIIFNCMFSVILSVSSGISIFSPWRSAFVRLPQRIGAKILSDPNSGGKYKTKFLVSQIWNTIIINMFQEHILSKEHAAALLYRQTTEEIDGYSRLKEPSFFMNQDDGGDNAPSYFAYGPEARRRLSFFAHSLSTCILDPIPVDSMPTFTVLIPHYSEKILLSLRDVIKEDKESKMSLLEYLRILYSYEWESFVVDSKELTNLEEMQTHPEEEAEKTENESDLNEVRAKDFTEFDDLPFYCVGFKKHTPERVLRTVLWASARTQTLYRTVSGFKKYFDAIKLLYRTENLDLFDMQYDAVNTDKILGYIAGQKVNLLVAMQRYYSFSKEEYAAVKVLVTKVPYIKIAVLEEVPPENEDEDSTYYSCLLALEDGEQVNVPGEEMPNLTVVYRVKLSGNPIIGDGKSDNQNHALIFYRGEYIQVIDANQDMYLEECLKIRSVLAEFEELDSSGTERVYDSLFTYPNEDPVAVVGAREHIFTEQQGVLGDVAAGKERTFGTLFARTLAEVGGKLHYGHPDFLNGIFMTTRGGISKAQKGIHLNEDIYAGMMALCRGGRIKHLDFFQCGKGRDLGFNSILNFTSKIGGGMGEQMLSREYFYLGTQLPLHRFLSFYYAHPGFHLNNMFIILSVQLFAIVIFNLGSLNHEIIKCVYDRNKPFTDLQEPIGCYNLQPVLDWVNRFVVSICICFLISFAPLFIQELTEKGLVKTLKRFVCHIFSMSPVFEVFACQIYSNSLKSDLTFGGARYIATGRGMATSRASFVEIYSRYAGSSLYSGIRLMMIIVFGIATMWQPLILWFLLTALALCFSPFVFNPHNFSIFDFFLDYREFWRWLCRGNSRFSMNSWISFTRSSRSKTTGSKRKRKTWKEESSIPASHRAAFSNSLFSELVLPAFQAGFMFIGYMFINSQTGVVTNVEPLHLIARMCIVVILPIVLDFLVLILMFPLSCLLGPFIKSISSLRVGDFFALITHGIGIFIHVLNFEIICFLEGWNFSRILACFICTVFCQRLIFQTVKICLLTRELKNDYANRAWWSGTWIQRKMPSHSLPLTQPIRELIVKVVEMSLFSADFMVGHYLFFMMTPIVCIPYVDRLHSCMLFWVNPKNGFRRGLVTTSARKVRRRRVIRFLLLYLLMFFMLSGIIVIPILCGLFVKDGIRDLKQIDSRVKILIQPFWQDNNDTGSKAPNSIITRPIPVLKPYKTHPY